MTQQLFNVSNLPPDDCIQYEKHTSQNLIKGVEMGPFSTNTPMTTQPLQCQV